MVFPWVYKNFRFGKLIGMPVNGSGTLVWWEISQDPALASLDSVDFLRQIVSSVFDRNATRRRPKRPALARKNHTP
jgi:hypothetical protein